MTYDGANTYLYDGEGRVCAVAVNNAATMNVIVTAYVYDADGQRVAKGQVQTGNVPASCPTITSSTTLSAQATYIVGKDGEQVSELDGSGNWVHSNVFADGELLATYDQEGSSQPLHFNIADPVGTKRVEVAASTSQAELNCLSLPFGDGLTCTGSGQDATEQHFADKERDAETGLTNGNDYFGARYYASSMGRFQSPDPSGLYYADPTNPQSLNLYSYTRNNPLNLIDPSGLYVTCTSSSSSTSTNGVDFTTTTTPTVCTDDGIDPTVDPYYIAPLDASIPEQSSSSSTNLSHVGSTVPSIAMAIPPGAPQSCSAQLADMLNDINSVRGSNASGVKGLAQRFGQIINGNYTNAGHIEQFQNRQRQLQNKIDNYRNSGCGEPPASVASWAAMPTASPWTPPNLQNFTVPSWVAPTAIITGGVACAVFVPGCLEVEGVAILAP